ncbi:substrate-binding domain-containing protein [Eubacteriales bacterium OttesenSCG-928-M02]|nr:substrate-binding domain-containing protein [Eubacteriales bacterium OttesenSCG-928-M02]
MKTLHILHAGCVMKQVRDTVSRFQEENPSITVNAKPGGSVDCIRRMIDGEPCDLIILADDAIIQSMMMPSHADGYVIFAGNSMGLVSTEGAQISTDTWRDTLLAPDATFGHFEPKGDPGGYRAVMAMMLADRVEPGLSQKLLDHPGHMVIEGRDGPRPQFMFTYMSGAKNSGMPYAALPDEMNLGNDVLNAIYQTAVFDLGETTVTGSAINHALTIPFSATEKDLAKDFAASFFQTDFSAEGFIQKHRVVGNDPLA